MGTIRLRKMVAIAAMAVLATAAPLAGPASADHSGCNKGTIGGAAGTPSAKGNIVVPVGTHPYVVYVDIRHVMSADHSFSIWLYLESNGKPGLQRGGKLDYGPGNAVISGAEECPDAGTPDTLLF